MDIHVDTPNGVCREGVFWCEIHPFGTVKKYVKEKREEKARKERKKRKKQEGKKEETHKGQKKKGQRLIL